MLLSDAIKKKTKRIGKEQLSKSMAQLDLDGVEDPIKDHFELIEGAIGDNHFQRYLQYKEETHGEPPIMRAIEPTNFND